MGELGEFMGFPPRELEFISPMPKSTSPYYSTAVVGLVLLALAVAWQSGMLQMEPRVVSSVTDPAELHQSNMPQPTIVGESPVTVATTVDRAADPLMEEITKKLADPSAVPNEALLTFRSRGDLALFLRQAAQHGLHLIGTLDALNTVRVGFGDREALRKYLSSAGSQRPELESNNWYTVPRLPKNDETNQGGASPVGSSLMSRINASGDRSEWGKGVLVAVLDTGVKDHPTFAQGQVTHLDLVADGQPFHSHGTSVASLIVGSDERVPGVAPQAKILDIRVANDKGFSVTNVLAQGIIEATNRGAQVINISMGGYSDSALLRQAVGYASNKGVLVVAAAGNESYDQLAYPAAIPQTIAVGSVDGSNRQAYFSNSGVGLDFVAPGVGVTTAWDSDKSALVSGTSHSTGIVSGIVAANLSRGILPGQMQVQMQQDAQATGAPPAKVGFGVARVTGLK
jgi:Subtilase family